MKKIFANHMFYEDTQIVNMDKKRCLTLLATKEIWMETYFPSTRITRIKKSDCNKYLWEYVEIRMLIPLKVECKMMQPLWKTV
jgi:hypothetical protein